MNIPAASDIEGAVDGLGKVEQRWRDDQQKELTCAIGASTCKNLGIGFPLSDEFRSGYEIGIQTARRMVQGSAELLLHGANPENVL